MNDPQLCNRADRSTAALRLLFSGRSLRTLGFTKLDKRERLTKLEELFRMPEVTSGFPSKQAGLSWANRVAPLLNFNPQYHEPFLHYLQIVSLNVSNYTAAPAFQNMLNQVEMAIEELKHDLASAPAPVVPKVAPAEAAAPSILKLEPNLYGIGVNLPALWQRAKSWLGKGKP